MQSQVVQNPLPPQQPKPKKKKVPKAVKILPTHGNTCFYCSQRIPSGKETVEHLVAKSNGGNNKQKENLVACCLEVNQWLGNKSVREKIDLTFRSVLFKCPLKKNDVSPGKH